MKLRSLVAALALVLLATAAHAHKPALLASVWVHTRRGRRALRLQSRGAVAAQPAMRLSEAETRGRQLNATSGSSWTMAPLTITAPEGGGTNTTHTL
jgi:hypothetical protein